MKKILGKSNEQKKNVFELKKLKIEKNYKLLDFTQIIIVVLLFFSAGIIAVVWLTNSFMIELSNGTSEIANSFSSTFEKNPELLISLNEQLPVEVFYLTILKQLSGNVDMDFKGHFTTIKKRSLEKVDLTCIDKYDYRLLLTANAYQSNTQDYVDAINGLEEFKDMGCVTHHEKNNVTYFKCPLRNCKLKEIISEVPGRFIPQSIGVTKLSMTGE